MSQSHILIIDDEPDIRNLISDILHDEGYRVSTADGGASAQPILNQDSPDLVLLDIWMPEKDGISLLKEWNQHQNMPFSVVMMSGHGTIETAIEATKMGARDFVEKPISLAKLLQTIEQTLTQHEAEKTAEVAPETWQTLEPLGNSAAANELRDCIEKLSKTKTNTLFCGDSGTGKMTLALWLHEKRHKEQKAAAIVDGLNLEPNEVDELWEQHTQLAQSRYDGGSIIITNIDCLIPETQVQLLSNIKKWQKPNQNHLIQVLSTSQQDIRAMINQGDFNRELGDCLSEFVVTVCPLSERAEDVPELLNHYINHLPDLEQTPYRKMSFAAQNHLRNYHWPGNIRELKNLVRQLQLQPGDGEIQLQEVLDLLSQSEPAVDATNCRYDLELREAKEAFERDYLLYHLKKVDGKVGDLAKISGMERTNLYRKLRSLNINPKNVNQS